jgi:hypothetical protein
MRLAGGLLLCAAAVSFSVSAAPAPSKNDQVIQAVLAHFARDTVAGVRNCVRPTLDPLSSVSKRDRDNWGQWTAPDEKALSPAAARDVDRLLLRAAPPSSKLASRVTHVPRPLLLAMVDEPATGPCALEGNKEEVWHFFISRPTFNGNWAFVEVGALADGKNPPPQLWAVELEHRQWRPRYYATRILWYD